MMQDVIIVGMIVFAGIAVVAMGVLRQWAIESRRLRMEERLKLDEMNQRILSLDDSGAAAKEIQALRKDIQDLSRQVAELKEQLQLLRGSHLGQP